MVTNSEYMLSDVLSIIQGVSHLPLELVGDNPEGLSGYTIRGYSFQDLALEVVAIKGRKSYSFKIGDITHSAIRVPITNSQFRTFYETLGNTSMDTTHTNAYTLLNGLLEDKKLQRLVRYLTVTKVDSSTEVTFIINGLSFGYIEFEGKFKFTTPLGYVPYTRGFDLPTTLHSVKQVLQIH